MHKASLTWAISYGLITIADIVMITLDIPGGRFFTKPLLMPLLCLYYFCEISNQSNFSKLIITALLCSWLGDLFLMFDGHFISGLISFLFAHIFYIVYITRVKGKGLIQARPLTGLPVLIYLFLITVLLNPFLGNLKIPVFIYSTVICCFLLFTINLFGKIKKKTATLFCCGAVLFVISDTLLAVARFVSPFMMASQTIMFTYCTAQFLIVTAGIRHLQSP